MPHKWFWHFYLVGVVANLAALALVLASALTSSAASEPDVAVEVSSAAVVSVVLLTHLFRRLAETLLVMRHASGLSPCPRSRLLPALQPAGFTRIDLARSCTHGPRSA